MIETGIFRADRGRFARLLFERHGQGWLLAGMMLVMVSLILGVLVDYRIFILAFIVICLLGPAMMMLLYFNYGMKGENYLNVIDHRLEIGEKELTVWLLIKSLPKEGEKGENPDEEVGEDRALDEEVWRSMVWPLSSFGPYTVGKDYVIFPFIIQGSGFLYLPREAFADDEDFAEAVRIIAAGRDVSGSGNQQSIEIKRK